MFRALAGICALSVLCGTEVGCAPHARPAAPLVNRREITALKIEWPPPTWIARFTKPTRLHTCVNVEQTRLCVGEMGERWLEEPKGALASPYLAPETLVAALPTASGRYVFVGERGTRYAAATPLGPFSVMQPALQRFESFQVVAGKWYGLNSRGELWRGAFGDPVGSRVPLTEEFSGFAIAVNGKGLAVSVPEALWWTEDAGEHWRALDSRPMGATGVSLDADGRLRLSVLLPDQTQPQQEFRLTNSGKAPENDARLLASPAIMADVRALAEGRAVFTGSEWFELRMADEGWYLARGRFDQPLTVTRTEGLDDCHALKLAARAPTLLAVCQLRDSKPGAPLQLRVAHTSSLNFTLRASVQGDLARAELVAVDTTHVLATGLCRVGARPPVEQDAKRRQWMWPKASAICASKAPVMITLPQGTASSARATLDSVSAPGANSAASPVAASDDGARAAFIGRSRPGAAWQLYLSVDGGRTFSPHRINGLPSTGAGNVPAGNRAPLDDREGRSVQSLNFGEDQSLALVLREGDAPVIYNFDDRGQLIATSLAPPEVSRVDAVGTRILAVSLTQRNVYQSLDRGASFDLVGHLPAPACRNYPACPVICRSAGCLVGERFTRVSWGAPGAEPLDIAGNPEQLRFEDQPATERVSFRMPITCEVQAAVPFAGKSARAPSAEQISIGDLLWYTPWQDPSSVSAGMYSLRRGQNAVNSTRALTPIGVGEAKGAGVTVADAGLAVNHDDVGLSVLRSKHLPRVGEPLGDLELAWLLFKRPAWVHASFRDAEPTDDKDFYLLGARAARRLLPSLLSATRDGVFVAPHAEADMTQFVTPVSVETLGRVPWPIERVRDVHWTKTKDSWVVHALDETGSVLLRATRPMRATSDAAWTFAARAVSNPRIASLRVEQRVKLRWGGPEPTLLLARSNRDVRLASLSVRRLTQDADLIGPSFDVSLPGSATDPPVACSARDRREMTRVVMPLLPKGARGVQVVERNQPTRWLVATQAVLYANAERTCLDAFWAEMLPGSPAYNAVIELGSLDHATVFRSPSGQLQASRARCKFDPHASPPPEYETRLQARWNLDHLPLQEH